MRLSQFLVDARESDVWLSPLRIDLHEDMYSDSVSIRGLFESVRKVDAYLNRLLGSIQSFG